MKYYINKIKKGNFDDVVAEVKEALAENGFGVLTEIDVRETLKKKLDVEFRNYIILGACNPPNAYKAFLAEDKIGILLPCNVIVQELEGSQVEVAAVDPAVAMQSVENKDLEEVASKVRSMLNSFMDSI